MSFPYFVRGAEAAQRIGLTRGGTYICPLCEQEFDEADYHQRRLTVEHVPPKSQGGTAILLTCERCNNVAGGTVDGQLYRRAQVEEMDRALGGEGVAREKPVVFKVGGVAVNATAHIDAVSGMIEVEVHEERNNPVNTDAQREAIRAAADGDQAPSITIRTGSRLGYVERLAQISELRAAYLLAFARFGYRYALHRRLDVVRQQLRNPDQDVIPYFCFPIRRGETGILQTSLGYLLVRLAGTAVVLPWIEGDSDVYLDLERRVDEQEYMRAPCWKVEAPRSLEMDLDFAGNREE